MSGQLASQDWQPALRNQRCRINQTSREMCLTPHHTAFLSSTTHSAQEPLGHTVCIHRDELHQLDDMINANIWDSSVDHQFHNYEHVSCHSARGISQFSLQIHSFFSVNVKGCIHLAVRFLSNPHPQTAPKAEGPLSCSLYTIKVGIRQKVRNVQW